MTKFEIREVTITAAVQAGRISTVEGRFLRLHWSREHGLVGEDDHLEAERIVSKIGRRAGTPKPSITYPVVPAGPDTD